VNLALHSGATSASALVAPECLIFLDESGVTASMTRLYVFAWGKRIL